MTRALLRDGWEVTVVDVVRELARRRTALPAAGVPPSSPTYALVALAVPG